MRHQIGVSGGEPDRVFERAAYDAIYAATDGVPRLVNQLCDHALVLATLAECRPVGAAVVEEAWSDLQQLPSPWQMTTTSGEAGRVVEFAALDDLTEEGPDAIPFRPSAESKVPAAAEQNLDQIERRLRELDEDFQPAGSIGPEIELRFAGVADPFGEVFEDEEIVIDRYASLEADLFADRPLVNSSEGRELSALLNPWLNPSTESTLSISAELGTSLPLAKSATVASSTSSASGTVNLSAVSVIVQAPLPTAGGDGDGDLIIIEDDPPVPAPSRSSAPLVRRQEYRQLFAKLRHG